MSIKAKTLKEYAQQVWMLPLLEDKKLILKDMVDNFDYKKKYAMIVHTIDSATNPDKLDELAANLTLWGSGLKVV